MKKNHIEINESDRRELDEALLRMIAAGELRTVYDPVRRDLILFIPGEKMAGMAIEAN